VNEMVYVDSDSGGKINILGSDFTGHCEKHSHEHVSYSEWITTLRC
jgi:hypothetical protein